MSKEKPKNARKAPNQQSKPRTGARAPARKETDIPDDFDDDDESPGRAALMATLMKKTAKKSSRVDTEPTTEEFKVIQELTLALIRHGDYAIRFIERLEEDRPTLLVSIKLPRGTQAGDSEVFALHEIAQRISDKNGVTVLVSTSNVSYGGERLKFDPGRVARSIGADVLFATPNFHACESQLKAAMEMLSADKEYSDVLDVMENLNTLARIYFYLGRKKEALLVLEKMESILSLLLKEVETKGFYYFYVYPEFNSTALLYAMFGEFDKAFALVDLNFDQLKKYVEKHDLIRRKDDPEDQEAFLLYTNLPEDITFSRQEIREKILFYKEKSNSSMPDCDYTLGLVDEPLKRFLGRDHENR